MVISETISWSVAPAMMESMAMQARIALYGQDGNDLITAALATI